MSHDVALIEASPTPNGNLIHLCKFGQTKTAEQQYGNWYTGR